VLLTVWVEDTVAVDTERDDHSARRLVRYDEYGAAQRLCFGELESSDHATPRLGELPIDHRRIVKR
jgi:hypothetical protein